jgi:TonB-linked SusC/RagA family outer membrane protein
MKEFYQGSERSLKPPKLLFLFLGFLIFSVTQASSSVLEISAGVSNEILLKDAWAMSFQLIKGKVTDESGQGIPGVSVTVIGDTKGAITDNAGNYSIDAKPADKLQFSYIGMTSQTITVGDRAVINVQLVSKDSSLDEVTVVAFGTQKKESVVSSITTMDVKDLRVPSSNLTTALAGRMSGLIAYQRSGEPGVDNADFFIRGVTSFGYTAAPLILIDGLEMRSEDLSRLQPDDIASFSILKDASATSLYGARGANGVIMVTTKTGKEGKATISVRYEKSVSAPTQQIELADPVSYMRLHNESVLTRDPLGELPYLQEKIESTEAGLNPLLFPTTDWHSMLFKKNTTNERMNFNVGGGGKVARYYVAATYNQDNGILNVDERNNFNSNIDLKKYLLRSNVNIDLTKTTEVVVRLHATFDDYTGPIDGASDLYKKVMHTNPVLYPAFYLPDAANELTEHPLFGNFGSGNYLNPYADLMKGYKDYTRSLMMAQFEVKQDLGFLLKGLKVRGMFSTTRYSAFDVERNYNPFYYTLGNFDKATSEYNLFPLNAATGTEYLTYAEGAKQITSNTYTETAANYDKVLGEDHTISGLLVFYMRNQLIGNAGTLLNSLAFRNMGLSGRATYGYKSKYFLEANFGYNGSERFSEEHRFGFFPSAGGAWLISNEGFWDGWIKKVMPKLKLKATTGLVGNDAIGSASDRFFYLSQVNMNDPSKAYTFGSEFQSSRNGITVDRYENRDITWETANKTNIGVEINILNNLDINADVYTEHRTNILMNRAFIPTTLGLQSVPRANVGEASGKGIDVSLDYKKNFSSGWWFISRANFTYATSEFKVFEEPDYSATPWKSRIGYSLGQSWGYVAERLFVDEYEVRNSPTQAADAMAGDIKYKDINGDGTINELDQVAIGYPTTPETIYGFGFSTGYKAFDLSCFFQGLGRESFWISHSETSPFVSQVDKAGESVFRGRPNETALLQAYRDSYWSEGNRDLYAIWPRLSSKLNVNNNAQSTWFMRSGAFLRFKSLEVGYTMPEKLTKKIGVSKARFYGSGTNLMTFSSFKLWDPEMAGNGLAYPVQRVINFGLQVSF